MQNPLAVAALLLGVASSAIAGYALMDNQRLRVQLQERKLIPASDDGTELALAPEDEPAPLAALPAEVERRLQAIEARVEAVDQGLAGQEQAVEAVKADARRAAAAGPDEATARGGVDVVAGTKTDAELTQLINKAVDAKAEKMARKWDKKPAIGRFVKSLGLTDVQQQAIEREVVRGQREMKALFETPTADGTVLLDEFVNAMASSMLEPEKGKAKMMAVFGRLMTETVPGTDETYATKMEAVKTSVSDSFRRDMTPEQYAEYEEWEIDPTEIKDIPDSPWKELETQVVDRAKQMGWQNPEENQGK